jgi:hypothetical protein
MWKPSGGSIDVTSTAGCFVKSGVGVGDGGIGVGGDAGAAVRTPPGKGVEATTVALWVPAGVRVRVGVPLRTVGVAEAATTWGSSLSSPRAFETRKPAAKSATPTTTAASANNAYRRRLSS